MCNSFRELVRIAKEWVNAYSEMPVSVRRLFKHTHLNTACRLLGVNSLSLEFLPERDASLSDSDGEDADEASKGWTGGGGKKPMVEDLEAARESHAAQNRAEAAAAAGAGSETVEGKDPAAAAAAPPQPPPVNGRKAEVGTPKQVVKVGGGASGGPGMAAGAAVGGGSSLSPGGKGGDREPVEMVPFAVMRGPEVEQERWEVCVCLCLRFSGCGVSCCVVEGQACVMSCLNFCVRSFLQPVVVCPMEWILEHMLLWWSWVKWLAYELLFIVVFRQIEARSNSAVLDFIGRSKQGGARDACGC